MPRPTDLTPADTSSTVRPALAAALRRYHGDVDEVVVEPEPDEASIAADPRARCRRRPGRHRNDRCAPAARAARHWSTPSPRPGHRRSSSRCAARGMSPPSRRRVTALATYSILPGSLDAFAAACSARADRRQAGSPVRRDDAPTEILEQPEVARRFLARAPDVVGPLVASIRAHEVDHVVIAARGTSDHAAIYAQYVLGVRHALSVGLGTPSVISLYGAQPRLDRSLVVGISQSGASPDVVAVIAAGRSQGAPTLAITNDPGSPLALAAETCIDLGAGPELAIAATKTYTTELLAIASLSAALSGDPADAAALVADPRRDGVGARARAGGRVDGARSGRGRSTARARARLRVRHRARMGVEAQGARPRLRRPVLGGRLRARAARAARARRAGPGDRASRSDGGLAGRAARRLRDELDADIAVVSDRPEALELARWPFMLATGTPEWLGPIVSIVVGQLHAMYLADARGVDPERPRNLNKVTRTR